MARKAINFTKAAIEGLPLPTAGQRDTYYDAKVEGLQLRVTGNGTRTFCVYRWVKGAAKPDRVTLGRYPDLSIEQARTMARQINAAIAVGENPADRKRAARAEMTFGELFAEYMERHARVHKKSWKQNQWEFDKYLPALGKRKLSAIKKADIQKLHAELGRNAGHYAANHVLALLSSVFNHAIDWGLLQGTNPASGIRKFREQSRDRFLQADELPRFFQALAEEDNHTIRDYFLISLLTGARRANVQAMRWEQISFERAEWRIPETKNGTAQTVPLMPDALQTLRARRAASESDFVFPGIGKTGHLVEPKNGWKRLLERAGLKDLRIHDLRRTLGSWQAATGANLSVIGKTLNHKSVSTTAIYARLNIDPVRQAMEAATGAMLATQAALPETSNPTGTNGKAG